ncbi:MAG: ZIP family metal transporter [Acidobacteria bacterium]|jgi:zinc transporter ZupT|nr:ZIP family metal transporter [Acidobacteriota bacterium]
MDNTLIQLLAFGTIAALANVLGGLILFPRGVQKNYKKILKYVLALGAGFMLAVTFIDVLPEAIKIWQKRVGAENENFLVYPMMLLLAGYLLTQFFEHTIAPHFHLGEEVHPDHLISPRSAYTAIGGLLIHTFFDGVSISAAAQVDFKVGILVFIAVFLHKFPEGFTIGSMVLAAGKNRKEVLLATTLVGATTLLGVFVFYLVGDVGFTLAYALPVASGVTLYVAASDLIPEVNHHGGKRPLVSFAVFAGVALFFLIHYALHLVLEN